MPQIADGIIFTGVLLLIFKNFFEPKMKIRQTFFLGLSFAGLTIIINFINYLHYPDFRFILSSLIYPFNIFVFIFTVKVMEQSGTKIIPVLSYLLFLTALFQLFYAVTVPQEYWREIGTFRNPNQLAYWSLLTASIVAVIKYNNKLTVVDLVTIAVCGFLQMLALSKAGIITFSLFLAVLFFSPSLGTEKRSLISAGILLFLILGIFEGADTLNKGKHIEDTISRIQNIGMEPDDSLEGRGYDRIWENPIYVVFGAGEGAYARFSEAAKELHSGLATILFSYGIAGVVLFGAFLLAIFRKSPPFFLALFIPILMFGIPGQNFRFTHFWIFMALIYSCGFISSLKKNVKTGHATGYDKKEAIQTR